MVEVEMAHRDDVDAAGVEAGVRECRHDPWPFGAAHRSRLVVETRPDAGLNQDSARWRLDEQAVQRLKETPVGVGLVACPIPPQDVWNRAEQRAGIGAEGSRLDECDRIAAAEVAPPVDGRVQPRRSASSGLAARPLPKSRWNADAVGSD